MTIALKNGAVILKGDRVAEDCACCNKSCKSIASVKARVTSSPEMANDVVASGTPSIVVTSFVSEQAARADQAGYYNATRGEYRVRAVPSSGGNWVTLLPSGFVTVGGCELCAFSAITQEGVIPMRGGGTQTVFAEHLALIDLCSPGVVSLAGYKIPTRLSTSFAIPEILASDAKILSAANAFGNSWSAFLNPQAFDSNGLCPGNSLADVVYSTAGGGASVESISVNYFIAEQINVPRPYAAGAVVYQLSGSTNGATTAYSYPGLTGSGLNDFYWRNWGEYQSNGARCAQNIEMSQYCSIEIEVTLA